MVLLFLELVDADESPEEQDGSLEDQSDTDVGDETENTDYEHQEEYTEDTSTLGSSSDTSQGNNDGYSEESENRSDESNEPNEGGTQQTSEDVATAAQEETSWETSSEGSPEGSQDETDQSDDSGYQDGDSSSPPQETQEGTPNSLPNTVPFLNLFWAPPQSSTEDSATDEPAENPAGASSQAFEAPSETIAEPAEQLAPETQPEGYQVATETSQPQIFAESNYPEGPASGFSYVEAAVFDTSEDTAEETEPDSSPESTGASSFLQRTLFPAVAGAAESPVVAAPSEVEVISTKVESCRTTYPSLATFVENCLALGVGATGARFQAKCCNLLSGWVGPGAPGEGCVCGEAQFDDAADALTDSALARIFGVDSAFMSDV